MRKPKIPDSLPSHARAAFFNKKESISAANPTLMSRNTSDVETYSTKNNRFIRKYFLLRNA
jgi:hypothetical protein